jgi:hypothetical protein
MDQKNAWRGVVSSMGLTILFWISTCIFLVIVCVVIVIAFGMTILLEVSAVWDKIKTLFDRKGKKNG